MLLTDFVGLIVATAPVIGLLVWERRTELRAQHGGAVVATGALDGESRLAITAEHSAAWNHGDVRSAALDDSGIGVALHAVLKRGPSGYDVVITCGGGS
jgi:hypothetical protein